MANTYTQIYIQAVFAVKFRTALIGKDWKAELHKYITGIIQHDGHKMLQINSMPDHIHIFYGMKPSVSVSSLIQHIKTESSKWINENKLGRKAFAWQDGYGAFSYSKSQIDDVIRYIQNQEIHHRKISFHDEYKKIPDAFGIDYNDLYLFKDPQ